MAQYVWNTSTVDAEQRKPISMIPSHCPQPAQTWRWPTRLCAILTLLSFGTAFVASARIARQVRIAHPMTTKWISRPHLERAIFSDNARMNAKGNPILNFKPDHHPQYATVPLHGWEVFQENAQPNVPNGHMQAIASLAKLEKGAAAQFIAAGASLHNATGSMQMFLWMLVLGSLFVGLWQAQCAKKRNPTWWRRGMHDLSSC